MIISDYLYSTVRTMMAFAPGASVRYLPDFHMHIAGAGSNLVIVVNKSGCLSG
jgi:hypothetical protein